MNEIRRQIETLEANGQLDTADTMEKLLDRNELLEPVYEAACATGLGSSEWANRLDIAIAAVQTIQSLGGAISSRPEPERAPTGNEKPPADSRQRKRTIRLRWSCSDYVKHEHRWRWTAWLCGRWQRITAQGGLD